MAVIDANAAVALSVDLPWSKEARQRIDDDPDPVAPSLLFAETGNAFWLNVRQGVLSYERARDSLEWLGSFLRIVPDSLLVTEAFRLAVTFGHPVYDCFYLALASKEQTHLLTADQKLAALARRIRTPVFLLY